MGKTGTKPGAVAGVTEPPEADRDKVPVNEVESQESPEVKSNAHRGGENDVAKRNIWSPGWNAPEARVVGSRFSVNVPA